MMDIQVTPLGERYIKARELAQKFFDDQPDPADFDALTAWFTDALHVEPPVDERPYGPGNESLEVLERHKARAAGQTIAEPE